MSKMSRKEALKYLDKKGKLSVKLQRELEQTEEFTEKDVKEVMKEGKIFGDPMVQLG